MRKASIWVAIVVIILVAAAVLVILTPQLPEMGCLTDADCVPASCCHPDSCTPAVRAPNCTDIVCTEECVPGTLDCGQGHCACMNGSCQPVISPAGPGGVPPSPALQEERCLEEGGSWNSSNLLCTCPIEGETFYFFYGCREASPQELCEDTGGTWEVPWPTDRPGGCSCPEGRAFDSETGCA